MVETNRTGITPVPATPVGVNRGEIAAGEIEGMDRAGIAEAEAAKRASSGGGAATILLLGAGALAAYYFIGRK